MQLTERMSHKKVVALKNENITIAFNRLSRGRRKAFLPFSNLSFYCFILTFFSTKISPDWSTFRLYACINSVNIIAEEDISYFNEAWLDFTANLSADLCYKSFVVTVIWLDLRLSSFKCIDNQRNPFSTYFRTRQNAARVIFVLRWTRTWFVEKKSNLKGLKWWPEEIKEK